MLRSKSWLENSQHAWQKNLKTLRNLYFCFGLNINHIENYNLSILDCLDLGGKRQCHHQTLHLCSGFILEPFEHWKALANSREFDKTPITRKRAGEWWSSSSWSLIFCGVETEHQTCKNCPIYRFRSQDHSVSKVHFWSKNYKFLKSFEKWSMLFLCQNWLF